jgi:hypothetical protein
LSTTLCVTTKDKGALAIADVKGVKDSILVVVGIFAADFLGVGFFCGGLLAGFSIHLVGAGRAATAGGAATTCCPSCFHLAGRRRPRAPQWRLLCRR